MASSCSMDECLWRAGGTSPWQPALEDLPHVAVLGEDSMCHDSVSAGINQPKYLIPWAVHLVLYIYIYIMFMRRGFFLLRYKKNVIQSHYRPKVPRGFQELKFPDYVTMARDDGKVVSPTHRPPLPPGNIPGTHLC